MKPATCIFLPEYVGEPDEVTAALDKVAQVIRRAQARMAREKQAREQADKVA